MLPLMFGSFILMFFGAHCMDKLDQAERTRRLEEFQKHGLTDEERY